MTRPAWGTAQAGRPGCYNGEPMRTYDSAEGPIDWAFSRGCASWVADPSTDPVPLAERWRCGGCAHFPHEAVERALQNRHDRKLGG